eukprot:CAMPEP_0179285800 /NCGR_PEP_ID=MMETSP0797-20121207/39400_1 /TAXON_ID=47934 /ORGANISM="Dinophysis acuminata, Strain DAEP01" /LENGTH=52 /DNA_ID=CAMNT_0020994639 /DNA_START=163 /DNA_END=319 /DNA_ORIENTATION=-
MCLVWQHHAFLPPDHPAASSSTQRCSRKGRKVQAEAAVEAEEAGAVAVAVAV